MKSSLIDYRKRYLSAPVLRRVRSALPRMSDTEREALEAGTVWWDGELFSGRPDWRKLLALPPGRLSADERRFLDGPCEELCRLIDDWQITFEHRDIPKPVWDFLKTEGFLGLIIPKEYGGKDFSATAISAVVTKIASRSVSVATAVIVPNSLGPGELLMLFGTEAQKDHYLPRLANGREVPAFALTSVDAGSDATAMTDHGVVCHGMHEGRKTLGIRLNWAKRYISLGPVCTVLGLAFKLSDPDHLLGEEDDLGITMALVPADTPGVRIGRRHYPAMQAFPNGPNSGENVFIPMDWVIGGRERVGQGWRMLVTALAAGRGIMLPSMSASAMKAAALSTGAYARIREQFNLPIGRFEGVQEALARIAGETYKIDAARKLTAAAVDSGEKPAVISAIMKYHATERMRAAVADAMDVHGGKGICDGPRNYLGSGYRAIPIAITVEGANILTRSLMIYGQGAIRCHPYILDEMAAANREDREAALDEFDSILFRHLGFLARTTLRSALHAWTFGMFAPSPVRGPTARYFRKANRLCAAFALLGEAALVSVGGALKRKEMLSGRLGDILSELYLLSAVLKCYEDDARPRQDLPLVRWAAETCLATAQKRMDEVLANLPLRPLAWLLRAFVLPFGRTLKAPSDKLTRTCADILIAPSPTRDRLTAGLFIGDRAHPFGALEAALAMKVEMEPLRARMREAGVDDIEAALAAGIVSDSEAERLHEAQALVRGILQVDDFAPEELTVKAQRNSRAGAAARAPDKAKGERSSPGKPKKGRKARARAGQST